MVQTIVRPSCAKRFNSDMQLVHDELSNPLKIDAIHELNELKEEENHNYDKISLHCQSKVVNWPNHTL